MKTVLIHAVVVVLTLSAIVAGAGADEVALLVCAVEPSLAPPVFVNACDRSAGVSAACPLQFTACAPALAAFLSLNGFKLANVEPGPSEQVYTIVGPTRGR